MEWLSERRRMFGNSNARVKTFEDFILNSLLVDTFYANNKYITHPVDTNNCTKYVISMSYDNANDAISIDKISNGIKTNLFSYANGYGKKVIELTVHSNSSITIDCHCLCIVIDPLDLNLASCDELLRSAMVIDYDGKTGEEQTTCIQNPYRKGADYVIACWRNTDVWKMGAKIVRVDNDISFTELVSFGYTNKLLIGVNSESGSNGFWHVYSAGSNYVGIVDDKHTETIAALSFDE